LELNQIIQDLRERYSNCCDLFEKNIIQDLIDEVEELKLHDGQFMMDFSIWSKSIEQTLSNPGIIAY